MQCLEQCAGVPITITSGTRAGSKGPHGSGNACDVGQNVNPGLTSDKAKQCYNQCFDTQNSFGQNEGNGPNVPGNHFHLQDRPGKGGAHNWRGGIAPYTPL